jgi:nucleolar GTP-binding protein
MARAIVGDALAAFARARRCAVSTRRSTRRGTGAAGRATAASTTRGRAVSASAGGGDEDEGEGEDASSDAVASTSAARTYRPGAFSRLPNVSPAEQLITSAVKRAGRVTASKGLKDAARERNKSAKQLDALTSGLCKPLKEYVKGFPAPERLHPFERALLVLTLSDKKYRTTLESVDLMRKGMLGIGKGYASQVTKTTVLKDATNLREKGFAEMEAYYRKYARCVDDLKSIAKLLRRLPVAELETPTVALVGAPNVGKSSLVRVLSSGMPEVCNYPFTTKGIKMGHFFIDEERHVVTDTPGLINRAEIDRNKIEMLTIATLEHLPTCVVFVTDLSGLSGTSIEDQLELREEIYAQFGDRRPWIDVFSKSALVPVLGGETDADTQEIWNDDDIARARSAMEKIPNAAATSADEGWGIDELKERMIKVLRDHKRSLPAADDDYSSQGKNRNKSNSDDLPAYIPML